VLILTIKIAPAPGWPPGAKPMSASGTTVTVFASGLEHPRWVYVLPKGVAIDNRGGLLVADDVGNFVWRVTAAR
jgi:glucose/arabinose dehydrogenase